MVDRPKKPFTDAHDNVRREKADQVRDLGPIRDKDNTAPRPKPPSWGFAATPRQAPRGAKGIKLDLPTPESEKAKDGFKLTGPGDLKREFKPIARGQDKDRGRDR